MAPTIASADAATSRGAVVHDADGRLSVEQLDWNPDVVLVDTALIAAAPARFLRWGIGDALATRFEMAACVAAGRLTPQGGRPTLAAMALADAAHEVVRRDARAALDAVDAGIPNAALEAVVEAALLLSGLGFEGGGLSIAHSVAIALEHTPGASRAAHGEQAAYGLLVQLALEDDETELADIAAGVGLPVRLREFGADAVDGDALAALAGAVMAAPWPANHPREPQADDVLAAIRRVERLEGPARREHVHPLAGERPCVAAGAPESGTPVRAGSPGANAR
jgi:glycerol dehydrogenase